MNAEFLKKLCETYSPSGNEDKVRELIKQEISTYADDVYVDQMGNLIVHKKGNGEKIMLAAHMDQIGLMVNSISEDGFLKFSSVGGLIPFMLISQKVVFENGVVGVINSETDLENEGDLSKLSVSSLYIDIGASTREEAEKRTCIGMTAVFAEEFYEDDEIIISKCIDNRIGCYILTEILKSQMESNYDIYYVFTVQEEVGCRGAVTAAYYIEPNMAISIDITPAGDVPGTKNSNVKLGKGAAIKLMDPSMITHPKIRDLLIQKAKENGINYQLEIMHRGGTDSGSIHTSKDGVPSGVISIPTRNSHTAAELINKNDVDESIRLLKALLQGVIKQVL